MYATRLRSDLQKNPELLSALPDGPNSGYLVIEDKESKNVQSCCSWLHKELPFPQDKVVFVGRVPVFFIPVLNHPLSHYCYYALFSRRKNQGKALTSSKEEDRYTTCCCCFFNCQHVSDVSPTPLDPKNLYQQFLILYSSENDSFQASTKALDGITPLPLRRTFYNWWIGKHKNLKLDPTAQGLDHTLRACLPEFKPPLFQKPVVVGKWYSPFTFVKEGTLCEQVERSTYYEVTLDQRWEKVFAWIKDDDDIKSDGARRVVMNNVVLESVEVFVGGRKARWNEKSESGVVWYTSGEGVGKKKTSVGLREEVVERVVWEQERGGWVKDKKVDFVDECPEEGGDWSEFGRYVLVESFYFRRMDGSLLISFDFKHFNTMRTSCQ